MASELLKRMLTNYIQRIRLQKNKNKYPSAVIGAENRHSHKVGKSGPVPSPLAPKLQRSLQGIGTIGTTANGNIIGCCCEVRASNQILLQHGGIKIRDIGFTDAVRPRTLQIVRRCNNCRLIFG